MRDGGQKLSGQGERSEAKDMPLAWKAGLPVQPIAGHFYLGLSLVEVAKREAEYLLADHLLKLLRHGDSEVIAATLGDPVRGLLRHFRHVAIVASGPMEVAVLGRVLGRRTGIGP